MAENPDSDQPADAAHRAHTSHAEAVATATRLIETLLDTAETFERTAALADREAKRREAAGRDDVAEEVEAAARAREYAESCRAHADEWRRRLLTENP